MKAKKGLKTIVAIIIGLMISGVAIYLSETFNNESENKVDDEFVCPEIIKPKLETVSDFGEVYYYLEGRSGLILCFHGTGGGASGWSNDGTDKNDFLMDFAAEGWSFVCPSSYNRKEKKWDNTNNQKNNDIQNIDDLLKHFGKSFPSIILVGHSNGGGFATRYAAFSKFSNSIKAIQLSNAPGITPYLGNNDFKFPILFNYADCDPVVPADDVKSNQSILDSKYPPTNYIDNNLDTEYSVGEYEHCHEFVNTSTKVLELLD